MNQNEDLVRRHALRRLASVFKVSEQDLVPEARFGHELMASSRSDFERNEFDVIDDDIKDVADKSTRKALADGILQIQTVKDYCDHMTHCYSTSPREVTQVLKLR